MVASIGPITPSSPTAPCDGPTPGGLGEFVDRPPHRADPLSVAGGHR